MRARTPNQKDSVGNRIIGAWKRTQGSDLRLGQFLHGAMAQGTDLFYVEDFRLADACEAFATQIEAERDRLKIARNG